MKSRTRSRLWRLLALLLVFSMVAAACGDDDDDTASGDDGSASSDDGGEEPADDGGEEPADDGEEPADDGGEEPADDGEEPMDDGGDDGGVDVAGTTFGDDQAIIDAALSAADANAENPDIMVGYLQWIYADEAGKRIEDAARDAVEFFGWGFESCDANGDPAQMPVCGNQLLDMGIDVLMTDGIPEAFITDVIERAASEGVPIYSAGGEVDPRDNYVQGLASDDTDLGRQLALWVAETYPDGARMLVQTFPAAWSDKRQNGLAEVIDGGANIEIVDTWEADPTNLVDGTAQDITNKINQFGDIDVVWVDFSVASIGAAQAIGAIDEADQPALVTFYANPTTVNDIREGRLDAAADEKLEWQSWGNVDAIAQFFALGEEPPQERAPDYGGLNFSSRQVVTIDTIPAEGTDVPAPPPGSYEDFFKTKWCNEFSNVPGCS